MCNQLISVSDCYKPCKSQQVRLDTSNSFNITIYNQSTKVLAHGFSKFQTRHRTQVPVAITKEPSHGCRSTPAPAGVSRITISDRNKSGCSFLPKQWWFTMVNHEQNEQFTMTSRRTIVPFQTVSKIQLCCTMITFWESKLKPSPFLNILSKAAEWMVGFPERVSISRTTVPCSICIHKI